MSSNNLRLLKSIYMQVDKFKDQFNMLTEPIIERTLNTIYLVIYNFNLNINPSEGNMENIENTLCRLVAVSQYITFVNHLTTDQYNELKAFTKSSLNNSKIINNTKAYVCIIYTKFIIEYFEYIIPKKYTPQTNTTFSNDEIKIFIDSLFPIINSEDFSKQNTYLCKIAFTSICEILCFVRGDYANLCDNAELANMEPIIDDSSLLQLERFLIKYVFLQKIDTNQPEKRALEILERTQMLKMWSKLFECNNSLPISLMSYRIFIGITTVSCILF